MTKTLFSSIITFLIIVNNSCESQDSNERIKITSKNVVDAIVVKNNSKFMSLIAYDNLQDMGKTEEMISLDLVSYYNLFMESNCTSPEIILTETYNKLGQKRVIVPVCKIGNEKISKDLHINLLFGPPDLFTLDKISGYELVTGNSDSVEFKPLKYWKK